MGIPVAGEEEGCLWLESRIVVKMMGSQEGSYQDMTPSWCQLGCWGLWESTEMFKFPCRKDDGVLDFFF